MACPDQLPIFRNLAPAVSQYLGKHREEGCKDEPSGKRNDNRNISASPSLAWARCCIGCRNLAGTCRNAQQEDKAKLLRPFVRNLALPLTHYLIERAEDEFSMPQA
jgi:hypothetical protein